MRTVYDLLEYLADDDEEMGMEVPLELRVFVREAETNGWAVDLTTFGCCRWMITAAGRSALLNRPEPEQPEAETTKPNPYAKKEVNARMLDKMSKDATSQGWTCGQWAKYLTCTPPSVTATEAWKLMEQVRLLQKAERAKDRRRKPKASEMRRNDR